MHRSARSGIKQATSTAALIILASFASLFSNIAHADTFLPELHELQRWNCPTYQGADCLTFANTDPYRGAPTKMIKVRVESDAEKPYLRTTSNEQLFFFSDNLRTNSPRQYEEILKRCQFRAKNDYCAIKATVSLDVVEKIEDWSLYRYEVVK